jgi:hypothetical protein
MEKQCPTAQELLHPAVQRPLGSNGYSRFVQPDNLRLVVAIAYPVEHHRGRLVPAVKLLGQDIPMVFEPKTYGCLALGENYDDPVFGVAFDMWEQTGFTHGLLMALPLCSRGA